MDMTGLTVSLHIVLPLPCIVTFMLSSSLAITPEPSFSIKKEPEQSVSISLALEENIIKSSSPIASSQGSFASTLKGSKRFSSAEPQQVVVLRRTASRPC